MFSQVQNELHILRRHSLYLIALGKEDVWIGAPKKFPSISSLQTTIEEGRGPPKHPAQEVNSSPSTHLRKKLQNQVSA